MAWPTTGGPATNSWAMSRTITAKWPSTALAAPMPTTLPSSTLTTGTVASCSVNMVLPRWPGRNEPPPPGPGAGRADRARALLGGLSPSCFCSGTMEATLPPPDEPSSRRTEGTRSSSDSRSRWKLLAPMAPSEWPPREVKSSAQTMAVRPSIVPQPPTWLAGVKAAMRPVVVVGGEAGDAADLAERALVEQEVDALAAGELAPAALAHDAGVGRAGRQARVGEALEGGDVVEHRRPRLARAPARRPRPGRRRPGAMTATTCPAATASPGQRPGAPTTPAHGAVTTVSIFIALMTSRASPAATSVAGSATRTSTTAPAIGLRTGLLTGADVERRARSAAGGRRAAPCAVVEGGERPRRRPSPLRRSASSGASASSVVRASPARTSGWARMPRSWARLVGRPAMWNSSRARRARSTATATSGVERTSRSPWPAAGRTAAAARSRRSRRRRPARPGPDGSL